MGALGIESQFGSAACHDFDHSQLPASWMQRPDPDRTAGLLASVTSSVANSGPCDAKPDNPRRS
jgi:hypothetical protein